MAVNYDRIGKRIQQLRKLKKLSQADLAEFTGMSVSYISHIETGIKHASLESVPLAATMALRFSKLLSVKRLRGMEMQMAVGSSSSSVWLWSMSKPSS